MDLKQDGATAEGQGPTAEHHCDLVMKGGITSGVIYPKLVSKLAGKYGFKNIGGTSAGAIAAGASAAAEYGRRHGNANAFGELDKLPSQLSSTRQPSGRSMLFTLFQPAASVRRHFDVLVAALNKSPFVAARDMVQSLLLMHLGLLAMGMVIGSVLLLPAVQSFAPATPGLSWAAAAIAMLIVGAGGAVALRLPATDTGLVLAGVIAALAALFSLLFDVPWGLRLFGVSLAVGILALAVLAVVVLLVFVRFVQTLLNGLHGNGYGLCSGQTAAWSPEDLPGLTNWLTRYLNKLAGLPEGGPPLTFGHLWGTTDDKAPRDINLEVMTSAVSQQMVYGIPFRDGTPQFFYDPDVWKTLFPEAVMNWLEQAQPDPERLPPGAVIVNAEGKQLKGLPRRADLPVVVAVRMSLSFPILLSAVPLHTVDWSLKKNQNTKKVHGTAVRANGGKAVRTDYEAAKVWFSDGGIGSNLPLHMFDALLPGHPTFAVNLKTVHPDFEIADPEIADNEGGRIYLPEDNRAGLLRYTAPPDDSKPVSGLISFLFSIVNTMQNWRDEIMLPYPGFRDRLVQISQRATEGGLNLDMPAASILALSRAGEMAADRLVGRFHPTGAQKGQGWVNHQKIRLGTFLGVMQPGSRALNPSLSNGVWHGHVAGIKAYTVAERNLATNFLAGLTNLSTLGTGGISLEKGALKPLAQVRITPRI